MRYHLRENGIPGPCTARPGYCPLRQEDGSESQHFSSPQEARAAYEYSQRNNVHTSRKKKKNGARMKKRYITAGILVMAFAVHGCSNISDALSDYNEPDHGSVTAEQSVNELENQYGQSDSQDNDDTTQSEKPDSSETSTSNTTAETDATPSQAELLKSLDELNVGVKGNGEGYSREIFISNGAWQKVAQNVLNRDLTNITMNDKGKIASGTLESDPYTGQTIEYTRGNGAQVDIDHMVALKDAYISGADKLSSSERESLASDPDNTIAVQSKANRSKGSSSADEWLPQESYQCTYVSHQILVKTRYSLIVSESEKDTMENVILTECK